MESVLVIAAHPDDEILGCGGSMARHIAMGDEVNCLILGTGVTSRLDAADPELEIEKLRTSARKAHIALGTHNLEFFNFPDNRFDTVPLLDIIQVLEARLDSLKSTVVYTHHSSDVNVDHRLLFDAVSSLVRSFPGQNVSEVRHFEVLSSTNWSLKQNSDQFAPNLFIDISGYLDIKKQALLEYSDEMREFPHSRSLESIDALAAYRGSSVGAHRAEAFEVSRRILN